MEMIELILGKYNYWIYIALMMIGFYATIAKENLIKKIIGLNIFQTAVFLFYISIGKVDGGTAPILWDKAVLYDNPLPHCLIIKIYKAYGTIEEDKILEMGEEEKTPTPGSWPQGSR